ncbi:MAG: hypothetical protein GX234_05015 [Clostridiales bacterium]|nr:hypothetical protein [Clostridiales bacterium]
MPWCPKCKNEYIEGIRICADCGCELVETLDELSRSALTFGKYEEVRPIYEFLQANDFQSVSMETAKEPELYELFVGSEEQEKAVRAVGIFYQETFRRKEVCQQESFDQPEKESISKEEGGNIEGAIPQRLSYSANAGVYQKSSEKAEEFRSSAYVLLVVGILGFIGLVLLNLGLLPIRLAAFNRYLINGVMGAMFLLFLVMGVLSMRSSKLLSIKATKEDELTREILNWCRENLTAEKIEQGLFADEAEQNMDEEAKYFKRTDRMQERITAQFMNLDEAYVEQLVDDYYQEVFAGNEEG